HPPPALRPYTTLYRSPMTSPSDGLGPQKDPNSGRTRVESGPAGTHRPTTRRGSAIAQPSVPRARCPECLARRGCGPARAIVTPDAPPAIAAAPEGNDSGGQPRRPACRRRRRPIACIDAGDIDAGETSAHRIEGEALLVV